MGRDKNERWIAEDGKDEKDESIAKGEQDEIGGVES